ncbi:MAG: DUF2460 domain-containing protein [Crenarchaeota archaeon]|nr:DUF2460 domain-containing protein [Thermoproteota archaeon]
MFQPAKYKFQEVQESPELRLGDQIQFGGINLKDADTSIGDGQSPLMENVNLDDGGKPTKRLGQEYILPVSKSGGMNGYYKELFYGRHVYAHGTKLYSYDGETETELMSGLSNQKGYFYVFNDVLYYKNRAEFISISNTFEAKNIITEKLGYIPTLTISREPTGGGTLHEEKNLIQPGFKDSFSGTSGATAYTMSYTVLDATPLTAVVNGTPMDEGSGFSVNRTTGIVTFNTAPGEGTNNVIITAYKTISGHSDKILKAFRSTLYGGGTNDSRIFCCGNDDFKNMYWYTGLTGNTNSDALYFPEFNFNRLGSDAKMLTNWTYMYASLIGLKEDGIYKIVYSNNGTIVTFPAAILNRQVWCDMPDSVQIIKNLPVFGNTQSGLWTIVNVIASENEKNLEHVSTLIDMPPLQSTGIEGLLQQSISDLQECSSMDDGKKYYLCVGDKVYVWDYERTPFTSTGERGLIWSYYTNINAGHWGTVDRVLHYGHRSIGQIVRFQNNLNDFGEPINGRWKSKMWNFNAPEWNKTISEIWLTTRAAPGSTVAITYYTESGEKVATITIPASSLGSFDWDNWDWDNFNWNVQIYPPTVKQKPKIKKITNFQIELSNNVLNENLSLLNLVVKFQLDNEIK